MTKKILFIDDDAALLSMIRRNLSMDFEVETVEGCDAALQAITDSGSFSVVVVDMQMPKRNGIQTIATLREHLPNTVFIMMTGNQDQSTAIQALNEGKVFRFLNKPAQMQEITSAIEAAQHQYNLVTAEKELLHGTFTGTINLLSDLIELPGDRLLDTNRMAESIGELADQLDMELGWEEKIAARIFLVGITMLTPEEARNFDSLDALHPDHQQVVSKICLLSAKLIQKIPRLGWIADVLKLMPKKQEFSVSSERREVAAVLLRVTFYWNFLTCQGFSAESTHATIQKLMPNLPSRLLSALLNLHDNRDAILITKVSVKELREGMVLHQDVVSPTGEKLIAAGRRLTNPMVENLNRSPELVDLMVNIVANSAAGMAMSK